MAKNINIILGGPSAEHEVSLATGWEMLKHIDKSKYCVRTVVISREKTFFYSMDDISGLSEKDLSEPEKSPYFKGPLSPSNSHEIWQDCDVALLALHGEFGEDGKVQGFLDMIGIPYTGSGVFASAAGMNKIASKDIFENNGLLTPPSSVYYTNGRGPTIDEIISKHGFPCFVKCPQSGSSRLLERVESKKDLENITGAFSESSKEILIESSITGDEYSCPVLEYPDGQIRPLPPVLIKPVNSPFFDFTAKYSESECEEIVPAPCSAELTSRIQEIALRAHTVLFCRGISRTDMIVKNDKIYVLETNTLPGFTSASLAPKSFISLGGAYCELLDILIDTALKRRLK
jgi:D-alanine-D-alanine ligase